MPTTISMYKANDGQIFDSMAAAIQHEQTQFFTKGLSPLLGQLLDVTIWKGAAVDRDDRDTTLQQMSTAMASDRALAGRFKELFGKLQLTPGNAVAKKRARRRPAAAPASLPSPSASVSESHLAELDALAGEPIGLGDAGAPPPPPTLS